MLRYPYYSSYEEVGNFLKEKIVDDNKKELFMPMCYMYRNAVELGLKRIIIEDTIKLKIHTKNDCQLDFNDEDFGDDLWRT